MSLNPHIYFKHFVFVCCLLSLSRHMENCGCYCTLYILINLKTFGTFCCEKKKIKLKGFLMFHLPNKSPPLCPNQGKVVFCKRFIRHLQPNMTYYWQLTTKKKDVNTTIFLTIYSLCSSWSKPLRTIFSSLLIFIKILEKGDRRMIHGGVWLGTKSQLTIYNLPFTIYNS